MMHSEILIDHTSLHALVPRPTPGKDLPKRTRELLALVDSIVLADVVWLCDTVSNDTMMETERFFELFRKHGLATPRSDGCMRIGCVTQELLRSAINRAASSVLGIAHGMSYDDIKVLATLGGYRVRPHAAPNLEFRRIASFDYGSEDAEEYVNCAIERRGWPAVSAIPLVNDELFNWFNQIAGQTTDDDDPVFVGMNTLFRWKMNEEIAMLLGDRQAALAYVPSYGRSLAINKLVELSWQRQRRQFAAIARGVASNVTPEGRLERAFLDVAPSIDFELPLVGMWVVSTLRDGCTLEHLFEKIAEMREHPEVIEFRRLAFTNWKLGPARVASELRKELDRQALGGVRRTSSVTTIARIPIFHRSLDLTVSGPSVLTGDSIKAKLPWLRDQFLDKKLATILTLFLSDLRDSQVDHGMIACKVASLIGGPSVSNEPETPGVSTYPSEKRRRLKPSDAPTIAIIAALPLESAAIRAVLNEPERVDFDGSGPGRIYWMTNLRAPSGGMHRIVIAQTGMGTNSAAIRASIILSRFRAIRSIIMCGIAGGIPYPNRPDDHVRLGDVVISDKRGVIQYDFVKRSESGTEGDHFEELRWSSHRPSAALMEAVDTLASDEHLGNRPWERWLEGGLRRLKWARPGDETDVLSGPSGELPHPPDPKRRSGQPRIFFGPIASSNTLLKDSIKRDLLREQYGVKAVEMEASGIVDASWSYETGYLVVRGVCDYCDKNKGDLWQPYAAVAAAAYVRALLSGLPATASSVGS